MAKQRYVNTKFWDDTYIVNLDPIEKLLFLYFLTNPLTNIAGIYEIALKRIAFDTGIDKEMVLKILGRFEKDNRIKYQDEWIVIRNFVKHQALNPKIEKGIEVERGNAPDWALSWCDSVVKDSLSKPISKKDSLSHINTNTNVNINSNLTVEMKNAFLSFYKNKKGLDYYFTGKDAGGLKQLTNKLKATLKSVGKEANLTDTFAGFLNAINDEWILENLSIPIINSKYNEILAKIRKGRGTKGYKGDDKYERVLQLLEERRTATN